MQTGKSSRRKTPTCQCSTTSGSEQTPRRTKYSNPAHSTRSLTLPHLEYALHNREHAALRNRIPAATPMTMLSWALEVLGQRTVEPHLEQEVSSHRLGRVAGRNKRLFFWTLISRKTKRRADPAHTKRTRTRRSRRPWLPPMRQFPLLRSSVEREERRVWSMKKTKMPCSVLGKDEPELEDKRSLYAMDTLVEIM